MIAAPSYDGKVEVWHASALSETCKMGLAKNINIFAIYMSYDSLVQRARNDIIQLALKSNVDDLVFIDCDVDWTPEDFFKLLDHNVDVVGGTYRRKSDDETYTLKLLGDYVVQDNGLVEVDGIGTGFLRISKRAMRKIWSVSEEYREPHKADPIRMVFDIGVVNGELVSEDNMFCAKWKDLDEKIYLDPNINPGHTGIKRWTGNFSEWIKVIKGL